MSGDTISIQPRTAGPKICRVSKVSTIPGRTVITAEKRLITLDQIFQGWSTVEQTGQLDHVRETDNLASDGPAGSINFVVKAENVQDGTWRAKIDFNCSLWVDGNYTTPVTVPDHLFMTFKLNDKVIPPGRVQLLDKSGTLQFDITDYCSISESEDTTNTLEVKIWNSIAKQANYYHTIEGTVQQISVTELLDSK